MIVAIIINTKQFFSISNMAYNKFIIYSIISVMIDFKIWNILEKMFPDSSDYYY